MTYIMACPQLFLPTENTLSPPNHLSCTLPEMLRAAARSTPSCQSTSIGTSTTSALLGPTRHSLGMRTKILNVLGDDFPSYLSNRTESTGNPNSVIAEITNAPNGLHGSVYGLSIAKGSSFYLKLIAYAETAVMRRTLLMLSETNDLTSLAFWRTELIGWQNTVARIAQMVGEDSAAGTEQPTYDTTLSGQQHTRDDATASSGPWERVMELLTPLDPAEEEKFNQCRLFT